MTEYKSPLKNALCEFKKLNIKITKEVTNTFFKSKYADLAGILDAVEAEAANFGIIVVSKLRRYEGAMELYTKVTHKDSEEIEDSVFPVFGAKPQEIGSSVTYARRYNIQCLLNLAAEDDDGNAANDSTGFKTARERTTVFKKIMDDLNNTMTLDELRTCWVSHTDNLNKLKQSDDQIYTELENRKNEIKKGFEEIDAKNNQ